MILLTFLALAVRLCSSGFVPPAEFCLLDSGLKELSGCIKWTDLSDECGAKDSEEVKLECVCAQEYLSSLYDCESDVQKCLASHVFDNQFQAEINEWHRRCDSRVSSTMTTPPLPTITQTYDFGACSRLYQSCLKGDYETRLCSNKYLPSSSLSTMGIYLASGPLRQSRTSWATRSALTFGLARSKETLSSIDLTSYLDITGASPAQTTTLDGWITQVRPNPAITPTATAAPLQVGEFVESAEKKLKQQGFKFW
ncbi:uncharacterized protein Z519_09464 [Cladophialophora bantiana CBS 173.52]|uniref:Extracellular membrane protein CFEM domain-containing protein n=1 Tax=Cladophialophora bantiana (strain ATCC 10958 / CBS 173.52 / CDC B-1940 / NIH 8579) TaxID=1442370 RepID=A0A0D2HZQ0_CLAB1|nr:uncharacterized protein Z519_09464 [Cladophialophora bantiana CBS 173.52]KIW90034.1 hypothetical protein Z519_09464 [Cladophialophora bantiana CBS 173.52]